MLFLAGKPKTHTVGKYIEYDDAGKISKTEEVFITYTIGEEHKKDQIIEIGIPDEALKKLHASIQIEPARLTRIINNGLKALGESEKERFWRLMRAWRYA